MIFKTAKPKIRTDHIEEITQNIYNKDITIAESNAKIMITEVKEKAEAIIRSVKKAALVEKFEEQIK